MEFAVHSSKWVLFVLRCIAFSGGFLRGMPIRHTVILSYSVEWLLPIYEYSLTYTIQRKTACCNFIVVYYRVLILGKSVSLQTFSLVLLWYMTTVPLITGHTHSVKGRCQNFDVSIYFKIQPYIFVLDLYRYINYTIFSFIRDKLVNYSCKNAVKKRYSFSTQHITYFHAIKKMRQNSFSAL